MVISVKDSADLIPRGNENSKAWTSGKAYGAVGLNMSQEDEILSPCSPEQPDQAGQIARGPLEVLERGESITT